MVQCVCVQYCMYVCMYVCYVMLLYWAAQLVCAVDGPCGDDVEAMYCTRVYSNTGLYIQHIYQNRTNRGLYTLAALAFIDVSC